MINFKSALWYASILFCVLNVRLLIGQIDFNQNVNGDIPDVALGSGRTDDVNGFPRIPICKWAPVSNWFITHKGYEGRREKWRELMEMIDDADELSGDISRPGSAEFMLREAVVHFSEVCWSLIT